MIAMIVMKWRKQIRTSDPVAPMTDLVFVFIPKIGPIAPFQGNWDEVQLIRLYI
jgi:hypothetical protein